MTTNMHYYNKYNDGNDDNDYNDNNIDRTDGQDDEQQSDELNFEVTDCVNGNITTQIYTVPFRPSHSNEKRLICFSTLNNEKCCYGNYCTYAHTLAEQVIDDDKKFIYQIILDTKLMDFFSMTNPKTDEIYSNLLFLSQLCVNCKAKKCTGGFNCRNGACDISLKICKNDLLTGECLNKIVDIPVDKSIINKLSYDTFSPDNKYVGCINGHHLTKRGLVPYYKFVHQKENSRKNKYQSVRYIDIAPLGRIFRNNIYDSDSESTDEEINSWFQTKISDDPPSE